MITAMLDYAIVYLANIAERVRYSQVPRLFAEGVAL